MLQTQEYHLMLPSLSPSSSRPYLLHQKQGAERGSHTYCLHKGSNSSPGVSCFGSVA